MFLLDLATEWLPPILAVTGFIFWLSAVGLIAASVMDSDEGMPTLVAAMCGVVFVAPLIALLVVPAVGGHWSGPVVVAFAVVGGLGLLVTGGYFAVILVHGILVPSKDFEGPRWLWMVQSTIEALYAAVVGFICAVVEFVLDLVVTFVTFFVLLLLAASAFGLYIGVSGLLDSGDGQVLRSSLIIAASILALLLLVGVVWYALSRDVEPQDTGASDTDPDTHGDADADAIAHPDDAAPAVAPEEVPGS